MAIMTVPLLIWLIICAATALFGLFIIFFDSGDDNEDDWFD